MKVTEKRLAVLRGMLHGFQSYNASVAFSGCDVGTLLGELLGYLEAEPQGAPTCPECERRSEIWDRVDALAERVLDTAKGASVRVSRVDGEPIGIELPGPQGAPTCCQGTDCGRCVGCLRVAKGAPQKPESYTFPPELAYLEETPSRKVCHVCGVSTGAIDFCPAHPR